MMIDTKKSYEDIGEVWYKSSNKAKTLNITIKPFETIKVNIPRTVSLDQAEQSVVNNKSWVTKERSKMDQIEESYTIFEPNCTYTFKDTTIKFEQFDTNDIVVANDISNNLLIHTPKKIEVFTESQQLEIRNNIIIPKMREWCISNVIPIAKVLAKAHGITIASISIRNSTTRWGSLGKNNNLNLSLYLATLPDELINYVILHELAHTKYKDHSKLYWGYLGTLCPGYKEYMSALKSKIIGLI